MSAIVYTKQAADGISFYADGTVTIDVVKYDIMEQVFAYNFIQTIRGRLWYNKVIVFTVRFCYI